MIDTSTGFDGEVFVRVKGSSGTTKPINITVCGQELINSFWDHDIYELTPLGASHEVEASLMTSWTDVVTVQCE